MVRKTFGHWMLAIAVAGNAAHAARGHFVFVVPAGGGSEARVLMSETLTADSAVDVSLIGKTQLSVKTAEGETPLALWRGGDNSYRVVVPGSGTRVIHGSVDLGVMQRGEIPNVLRYFPKTILGAIEEASPGKNVPVELVPVKVKEGVKLLLLVNGQPKEASEVTVILPGGSEDLTTTDKEGMTKVYTGAGRYGAWARNWEDFKGEREGKKYDQVRNYATLVFSTDAATKNEKKGTSPNAAPWLKLPEETSSFGGVGLDGWMYIYGGHIVPTHAYHTKAVSGAFHRVNIADGKTWQKLPDGTPLQGMNLAAADGWIYRIGGMQPRNKEEDAVDNHSIADGARFDPAAMKWEAIAPLPQPRSSHDMVALNGKMYVIGGWNLKGADGIEWPENMAVLDLPGGTTWKILPQPFTRRALIATAHRQRIFVLGGFEKTNVPSRKVDIYDPATGQWSAGPELPGEEMNGFSPAACELDRQLFVSVGDGGMYRLNDAENRWELIAWTTPRIVHRLVPAGAKILVVGGAAEGGNLDLVEAVTVQGE